MIIRTFLEPAGLKNKGNTCFFNSTIQCLLSIPDFVSFFKRTEFSIKKQPISHALKGFILDYQNVKIFDPHDFIKELRKKIKLFDGQQQDAHSFLEAFLNILIEEQNSENNPIKNMFNIASEDLITCKECYHSITVKATSPIQYLFIINSTQESFNNYCAKEDLIDSDSPWQCPKCGKKRGSGIKHKILETSEYIIVHLNRFLDLYSKNNKQIEINAEITINNIIYENIGVVCHSGSLGGGHYFSTGKRDNEWYEFNDSNVSKTTRIIESHQPYILFYSIKNKFI